MYTKIKQCDETLLKNKKGCKYEKQKQKGKQKAMDGSRIDNGTIFITNTIWKDAGGKWRISGKWNEAL